MKIKLITVIMALITFISVNAQSNQKNLEISKKTIVGKWVMVGTELDLMFFATDSSNTKSTLTFDKNDTYQLTYGDSVEKGTYKIDGDKLILTSSSTKGKREIQGSSNSMLRRYDFDDEEYDGNKFYTYYKRVKE
jgi:hypothetical protein